MKSSVKLAGLLAGLLQDVLSQAAVFEQCASERRAMVSRGD